MKPSTRVNHPPGVVVPPDNRPLVAPIYQSVKFTFDDVEATEQHFRGERPGFYYSRISNPTLRQLELTLVGLQGRDACLLTSSGVAAVNLAVMALCRQGDHVLVFVETYQPTRWMIRRILGRFGVRHTMLSIDDCDGIERLLATTPTRLIVFETPTNPVLKIADIPRITALARAHGALTLLDNTFAGFHNHGQFDVDLFVHSLTKYASGHGDVMGGAIIAGQRLIDAMRTDLRMIGATLDPHAAWLIQRGLKTYFLRYERQCENAQRVAEFLEGHPAVVRVHYPGLASHPQHELAARQMRDFGSMVSFDIEGGLESGTRFAESLALFPISASLGSTESLVVPPRLLRPRDLTPEQLVWSQVGEGTVRLSIGIEDADDLLEDLGRALAGARG